MNFAEIRIKHPGTGYGSLPPFEVVTVETGADVEDRARFLADHLDREIRWNLIGSVHGHYVVPSRRIASPMPLQRRRVL